MNRVGTFLAYAEGKRIIEVGALSQSKVDRIFSLKDNMFHVTGYLIHSVVMHLVHTESGTVFMFVFYHIEEAGLLHALRKPYCKFSFLLQAIFLYMYNTIGNF